MESIGTGTQQQTGYTLWQLIRYFLWLSATGFGGPVALVVIVAAGLIGLIIYPLVAS